MKLNSLTKVVIKDKDRVGRGSGSGGGKTCKKGHKGQGQRHGKPHPRFEGGQTPVYRRIPQRGLGSMGYRANKKKLFVINVRFLKDIKPDVKEIKEKLQIPFYYKRLKVIGEGKYFDGKIVNL